jgi:hypothetical protein
MLVGHYSAAFAAKRLAPSLPLPLLFIACQAVDICWSVLVLLGIEKLRVIPDFNPSNPLDLYFMPYTHSLPAVVAWSAGAGALYWLCSEISTARTRNAVLIGAVVGSHWILDFIVHLPDLPLWHDSFKVGLGLWNFRYVALALEIALLWVAAIICLKIAGKRHGRYLVMTAVMSAVQIFVLLMPLPLSDVAVAWQLLATYLTLSVLACWTDRERAPVISGNSVRIEQQ